MDEFEAPPPPMPVPMNLPDKVRDAKVVNPSEEKSESTDDDVDLDE